MNVTECQPEGLRRDHVGRSRRRKREEMLQTYWKTRELVQGDTAINCSSFCGLSGVGLALVAGRGAGDAACGR